MANQFKSAQFTGKDTIKPSQGEERVVKVEGAHTPVVRQFELENFHKAKQKSYAQVRKDYGSFATTDTDKPDLKQKDRRFALHNLARGPLAVDAEEQRVIQERVREQVAALSEEVKASAHGEGYQEGLKRGYEEAFKKFQTEGAARIQSVEKLLASLEGAKAEIFKANERFLIELVYRIARMVLLKELTTDKEYVIRLARELIERVGVRENIKLRVSPSDAESLGMLKEGLERSLGQLQNLSIEISKEVVGGGCRIETEWNAIDASIQTQLEAVRDALVGPPGGGSAT